MAKHSKKHDSSVDGASKSVLEVKNVDPSLALLFASSSGPVKAPPKARYQEPPPPARRRNANLIDDDEEEDEEEEGNADEDEDDEILSSIDGDIEDESDAEEPENPANLMESKPNVGNSRKRKHNANADDIEGRYLSKLAREEEKEEAERKAERESKRQKVAAEQEEDNSEDFEDVDEDAEESDSALADGKRKTASTPMDLDVPMHETLAPSKEESELEKSARTVFLANVSTSAITSKADKKTLLDHMGSFLDSLPVLPNSKATHKVESIRFRSTAYAGTALPKKAAFAKKQLMEATTKSTNAYVVYSTAYAAREAVKRLNATIVLDRHLRVDGVAHPTKIDHRRCVFVGNLGFVDDESLMDQGGENERKRSKIPSDIEEGLWRQFGKAGAVESVRVVRDEKTRVGKGFAYVQFKDGNSVEAALLFNEKKYPPMLPRILRVTRAKALKKTALASQSTRPKIVGTGNPNREKIYNPKITPQTQSLQGRASKLLGKAGAAQLKRQGLDRSKGAPQGAKSIEGIAKTPEAIIFEGHRATASSGKPKDLKLGAKKKKGGKPVNRSSKRGNAWKKQGGKHAVVSS